MPHVIEAASSARAKCRGCARPIAKDELRFGERHPNAFGEGEMTLWFHLPCAAYKRPETFLEAAAGRHDAAVTSLLASAELGIAHRRLPRIDGAERAATGRARCRSCRELIAQGDWRIPLVFFEEFRFSAGGFVHATCARAYFETTEIVDRIAHFSAELGEAELAELRRLLENAAPAPAAER
jgi:hypothetical protein